jgi:DNA modification methylase
VHQQQVQRLGVDYTEALKAGAKFPPIVVFHDGSDYWPADGFHRLNAHARAGLPKIAAEVRTGTRRDALLFAVGANAAHGKRRTNEDKRRAVLLLLADEEWGKWSDREIARRCAVDNSLVSKIIKETESVDRQQMARTCTRNGVTYTMKPARGKTGRWSPEAIALTRDTWIRDDEKLSRQISLVAEADQPAVVRLLIAGQCRTVDQAKLLLTRQRRQAEMRDAAKAVKLSDQDCRIFRGDSLEGLPKMEAGSVDLVFADPQYNIDFEYREGGDAKPDAVYLAETERWVTECARLLRDGGSMFVMINSRYSDPVGMLLRRAGLERRDAIIWDETGAEYARVRLADAYRVIHWYVKGPADAATFNADAILEESERQRLGDKRATADGRVPSNVWRVQRLVGNATERIPDPDAPPQLPVELVERVVLMASNPGELVLDPFSGTGTTARAAVPHGRRYVGVERDRVVARKSQTWIKAYLAERRSA